MGCASLDHQDSTNSSPTIPARMCRLHQKSSQSLRAAFTKSALTPPPEQAKRKSVHSLEDVAAWNRISLTSINDVPSIAGQLRVHIPSPPASIRSDYSPSVYTPMAESINQLATEHTDSTTETSGPSPLHPDYLPRLRRFAVPNTESSAAEPFPDYVDRVLQPDACVLAKYGLSASELSETNSPVSPVGSTPGDKETYEGAEKCTEEEWLDLEHEVLKQASSIRGREGAYATLSTRFVDATKIDRSDIKLVTIPPPKTPATPHLPGFVQGPGSERDLMQTSFLDPPSDDEDATEHGPSDLPFSTYGGIFDPFEEPSPALKVELAGMTKQERREFSIIGLSRDQELYLENEAEPSSVAGSFMEKYQSVLERCILKDGKTSEQAKPKADNSSEPADVERVDELRVDPLTLSEVKPAPHFANFKFPDTTPTPKDTRHDSLEPTSFDAVTGVLTRHLTNASKKVPTRVMMNDSYPLFSNPKDKTPPTRPLANNRANFSSRNRTRKVNPMSTIPEVTRPTTDRVSGRVTKAKAKPRFMMSVEAKSKLAMEVMREE